MLFSESLRNFLSYRAKDRNIFDRIYGLFDLTQLQILPVSILIQATRGQVQKRGFSISWLMIIRLKFTVPKGFLVIQRGDCEREGYVVNKLPSKRSNLRSQSHGNW